MEKTKHKHYTRNGKKNEKLIDNCEHESDRGRNEKAQSTGD